MTKISSSALLNLYALNKGVLDAVFVTTIEGLASEINTIYGLSGILGLGNEEIIVTDTSVNVDVINNLDARSSCAINSSSITTQRAQPQISSPLTPPPASPASAMKPSPSPTPASPPRSSTTLMPKAQLLSTALPSTPSPWRPWKRSADRQPAS